MLDLYLRNILHLTIQLDQQTKNTMKTITNLSGSKAVNIRKDATGTIRAFYVQFFQGMEQVLLAKDFANIKNAEKWAEKILRGY